MKKKLYFKNVYVYDLLDHRDIRGFFIELFNKKQIYNLLKINFKCCQTSLAYSKKNVFRGFHFQKTKPIGQLITVIRGKVDYYFVDIRKNSKTFGKYRKILLSHKNKKILYLPEGFAGGYHCLDDQNFVLYHHNDFFYKKFDDGFNVFSKNFNLKISKKVTRSNKDRNLRTFEEIKSQILK